MSTSNRQTPRSQSAFAPLAPQMGGDVTVGTSTNADYTSIQAAINSGADRVLIEPGLYQEAITLTSNVQVIGSGADLTWIAFPNGITPTHLIEADGVSNITFMNVSLIGDEGAGTGFAALNGSSNVTLTRVIVRDMATAVHIDGATTDLKLKNNTIVGNINGVDADNCAPIDIRSTIFAYNTGTTLAYEGCASQQLHTYNLYWANGTDQTPLDPGSGELFSNPLFIDYGDNDFRVEDESPVIDAGAPGDPMPPGAGSAPDIGHREQTASSYFADDNYCDTCENDGLVWGVDAFATIQDAVDAALADQHALYSATPVRFAVGVGAGTFTESVVISGSLDLLGSDADESIIVGDSGAAVTFKHASHASVSGFSLIGSGANPIGVWVTGGSRTITLTRNLIHNNETGILMSNRSTGAATFNTIISNTVGVQTGVGSVITTTQYNWIDLENNLIAHNDSGLVANGLSVIFSNYNLYDNTLNFTNIVTGSADIVGQDPLLTGAYGYLTVNSPALDAANPLATTPSGGGIQPDIGWHELQAAPISILMGQPDDSVATESIGVAQVEYAIVATTYITEPITSTLPSSWSLATLNNTGATLSYWQETITPTTEGYYRIYSRATDSVGNTETNPDNWFDGSFVVDGNTPVVTMTVLPSYDPYFIILEGGVTDYVDGSFDIEEIYFELDGERVEAVWSLTPWTEDGSSPRTFRYLLNHQGASGKSYTVQAFAVDGAGQVGQSTTATASAGPNPASRYDGIDPQFLNIVVSHDGPTVAPFDDLVTGTVTFAGTAEDPYGDVSDLGRHASSINGYDISFDGGASWDVLASWDGGFDSNVNFRYEWHVVGGLDGETIPVQLRVTDNAGNSTIEVITITVDTEAPSNFYPIEFSDFSTPEGFHVDTNTDMRAEWRTPLDGSGTVNPKVLYGTLPGRPEFDADGLTYDNTSLNDPVWYASIGVEDDAQNISYVTFGPWYAGYVRSEGGLWRFTPQSLYETIDGSIDIDKHEWLTATEQLDTDTRPIQETTIYAAWDGMGTFFAWDGSRWETDGTMWVYYDFFIGGSTQGVSNTASLPFEADRAIQVDETGGLFWEFDGGAWTATPLTPSNGHLFGYNAETGSTEMAIMPVPCCPGTDTYDSHRMLAFAMNNSGEVWSAFPTSNDLNSDFDYFYDWNITDESDLLELPTGGQAPFVLLDVESDPPALDTVSEDEMIQYLVTLTSDDAQTAVSLSLMIDVSNGLTYDAVSGATCTICTGENWSLSVPPIAPYDTHLITLTMQLDSDLTGIPYVTVTHQLTDELPLLGAVTLVHEVDITPPDVNTIDNPGFVSPATNALIVGEANDNFGSGVALVEVSLDGVSWQTAVGQQSWSADIVPPVTDGTWQLYVRATDYHSQTTNIVVTYTVDNTAPIIAPTVASQIGGSATAVLSGKANDPAPTDAQVQRVSVQFNDATASWKTANVYAPADNGEQNWAYSWALPTADGVVQTLRFRATDYAGNITYTDWFTTYVDTVAPTVSASQQTTITTVSNPEAVLTGTVTDGTAVSSVEILIYPQVGSLTTVNATLDGNSWSYVPALDAGVYTLRVRATDSLGNARLVGTYSLTVAWSVTAVINPSTQALEWDDIDSGCTYSVYQSSQPYSGFTAVSTGLAVGSYDLSAELANTASNSYYYIALDCGADPTLESNTVGEFSFMIVPGD